MSAYPLPSPAEFARRAALLTAAAPGQRGAGLSALAGAETAERTARAPEVGRGAVGALGGRQAPARAIPAEAATPSLVLTLPWAVLVPDNARLGVLGGRALLTRRYRTAKTAAVVALARQFAAPLGGPWTRDPVCLDVALYLPDRRRRDTANLFKLVGDALEAAGVVADDAQLTDVRAWRAGLDSANARAVLTLTLTAPGGA